MVDRNLQVSYLIVDEMHHDHPELIKDQYWDEVFPNELPYTVASERFREEHPEPSTAKIEVSNKAAMPTTLSSVRIDELVGSRGSTKRLSLHEQTQNSDQTQTQTPMQAVNYKFPEMSHEEEVRIKISVRIKWQHALFDNSKNNANYSNYNFNFYLKFNYYYNNNNNYNLICKINNWLI